MVTSVPELVAAIDEYVAHHIGMPNMNGYELARRIRRETWAASMFLVAATGWGQED